MLPKVAQKGRHSSFDLKVKYFKMTQKVIKYFGYFYMKFVARNH